MPLPRDEMETVMSLEWGADEMTFGTTNPTHVRHMERLGYKPYRIDHIDKEPISWTFKLPAPYFKLPRPKKRVGEAQRKAAGERMRKAKGV